VLKLDFNPQVHDREIRIDHGWVVKIGRGLNIYQPPECWFAIGAHDLGVRLCLATKVDIHCAG